MWTKQDKETKDETVLYCDVMYCTVPTVSTAVLNNDVEHCSGDNTWDSVMRSVWVYCIHVTRNIPINTINSIGTLSCTWYLVPCTYYNTIIQIKFQDIQRIFNNRLSTRTDS